LVVVGHCIPDASAIGGVSDPVMRLIYNTIYSFHMPLFFFISGYFLSRNKIKSKNQSRLNIIKKRIDRLLVPYIFVGLCYAPFKLLLSNFANKPYDLSQIWQMIIGVNPDGELWFLYALFVITCIVAYLDFKSNVFLLLIATALAVFSPILPIVTGNILFFMLGMYIRDNHKDYLEQINNRRCLLIIFLFVFGNYMLYSMDFVWARVVTAISGILLCLKISSWAAECFKKSIITKVLVTLGMFSMDIYILSDIIKIPFRIVLWNKMHMYMVSFCVCTISAIVISYFISKYIIRRNNLLMKLVLGIKN